MKLLWKLWEKCALLSDGCYKEKKSKLLSYFRHQEIEKLIEEIVSPLLYAVLRNDLKLVTTLLQGKADLSGPQSCPDQNAIGEPPKTTILAIAKALGNKDIIKAIEEEHRNRFADSFFL